MIVRILEDGQYEIDEHGESTLEPLDGLLTTALDGNDEAAFHEALAEVIAAVHHKGKRLDATTIVPSDLALPAADSSLDEARALLASEPATDARD